MPDFRYAQFCPLARAMEILGDRWTMLVIRELFLGPQRFSDLRRRLPGLSSSVLTERLARLEARGLLQQRSLAPPASSTVYELTGNGRGLKASIVALARWGARFLGPPLPGDHMEPDWVRLALFVFASRAATPERSYTIRIPDGEHEVVIQVQGGADGTLVSDAAGPADLTLRSEPLQVLGLVSGLVDPHAAIRAGSLAAEGDLSALDEFPALFDNPFDTGSGASDVGVPTDRNPPN